MVVVVVGNKVGDVVVGVEGEEGSESKGEERERTTRCCCCCSSGGDRRGVREEP